MSIENISGVGIVHLNTTKKARVVPGHQRHRWLITKLLPGQSTTCDKCGCVKKLTRTYQTRYQPVGAEFTDERPNCTGVQRPTSQTA